MISASDIFSKIRSRLDDDLSGRYDIPNDLAPAVNASIGFWVRVLNAGFEAKRLFPESLSELVKTKVYDVTEVGKTGYVKLGDIDVWTIFGVDPDPAVTAEGLTESKNRWATRLTLKEWNDASDDPFSPGTLQNIPDTFARPGYIGIGTYNAGLGGRQIAIRPASLLGIAKKAAIWYLENPDEVVDANSPIRLPFSMIELLVTKAVQYISHQHGPQSPYFQYSERDVMQAAQILNG